MINKQKNARRSRVIRSNKGITLIALIITIIVILILVAVSLSVLTGENGILTQANNAKETSRYGRIKEESDLWKVSKNTDRISGTDMAENAVAVINRLYNEELITEREKNDLILGKSIVVGGNTINFEKTLVDMYKEGLTCDNSKKCMNIDHLHIGDTVAYKNPTEGSYDVEAGELGVDSVQSFDVATNQLEWKVLGLDEETGGLKLISSTPMKSNQTDEKLVMSGAEAYLNAEKELDNIGNLYKTDLAVKARSLKIEDINEITGITTEEKIKMVNFAAISFLGGTQYGETYSFDNSWSPETWIAGKTAEGGTESTKGTISDIVKGYIYMVVGPEMISELPEGADISEPVLIEDMLYVSVIDKKEVFDLLFGSYESWVASCGNMELDSEVGYGSFISAGMEGLAGAVGTRPLFMSTGEIQETSAFVRPVVILDANLTPGVLEY